MYLEVGQLNAARVHEGGEEVELNRYSESVGQVPESVSEGENVRLVTIWQTHLRS